MILIRGRWYNLPRFLEPCSSCKAGHLEWDGKRAWRCNHTRVIDGKVQSACQRALALSAIFDDRDIELRFGNGRPDLARLQLTPYAVTLVQQGMINLPWLTPELLAEQVRNLQPDEPAPEGFEELNWLMRQPIKQGDVA